MSRFYSLCLAVGRIVRVGSPLLAILIASTQAAAQKTLVAKPVFEDGEAQVVPEFNKPDDWIRHDLWVETEFDSDGDGSLDRMHVSVARQEQTDTEDLKVPVIYGTSPYYAGTGSTSRQHMWNPRHELGAKPPKHDDPPEIEFRKRRTTISNRFVHVWVPRGFAVVHSSSPGTGRSQGCPTVGGDNESLAPKAVIDWLNGRANGYTSPDGDETVTAYWCTGKVGMTGTSYNGTLPLAAATTGVKGLEAIIPVAPNTSYYHYYRSNGLIRHPGGYMGEDIDVLYNFIHSGDPQKRDYCDCNVRSNILLKEHDRVSGDYNEFWAGRDYLNDLGPMTAATLMSHGFNDWNVMPEHSYRIYDALRAKGAPVQTFYHQGGHGGPPPLKLMNRWFTRYLYDVPNDVEKDPRAWIVREGADRSDPTPYPDYPNPAAEDVTWHLQKKGEYESGLLTTSVVPEQGTQMLIDNVSFNGEALARAEWSNHRLLFVTELLSEPLHISGTPRVSIRLASNRPAVNLSVWLVSLPWNSSSKAKIYDNIITRGWADPQNHASLTHGEPLEAGRFYDVTFDLQPDDQIIAKEQQIGLMIFSSDRDFTLWPKPGTELTVDLDATSLTLPIVSSQDPPSDEAQ
jgi:X-Pro dipeptidyl-peptidase